MNRWRNRLSNLALLTLLCVGLYYLLIHIVRIDPTADPQRVTIHLATSGGLLDRSEVTYRGSQVGKVAEIGLRPNGVAVELLIDEDARIPVDSEVRVAGLSVAGEQYIDFRPRTDSGPFLADGAVIGEHEVETPTHFAQLLANITGLAEQADPDKLRLIFNEMSAATSGTADDLGAIIDGGDTLLAGLEDVLPETLDTVRNGSTVVDMVVDLGDEQRRIGRAGKVLASELKESDPEIRELLAKSPGALRDLNGLLTEIRPTTDAMLGDLLAVSEVVAPRTDALSSFFPELAKGGDALSKVADGGLLRVVTDIWPRVDCDYGTPARPPTEGGWPEPHLDARCPEVHPELQQRGSYNAPRPANDPAARQSTGARAAPRVSGAPSTARPPAVRFETSNAASAWYTGYFALIGG